MRPDEIREHLRKQPFQPIRVIVSDGSHYDVRHPEFMFVTRTEIVIGLGGDDALPERKAYVDPIHITRIEPLPNGRARRAGRRRKK